MFVICTDGCSLLFMIKAHHLRCLNDFVDAQAAYYAQCYQYMVNLQKQLGRLAHFYIYMHLYNTSFSVFTLSQIVM